MGYSEDCRQYYNEIYLREYASKLHGRTSPTALQQSELYAQKEAMQKALVRGIDGFCPTHTVSEIWEAIRKAHIQRKIGPSYGRRVLLDDDLAATVFSAYQSWVKSSGHAFEEYIPNVLNAMLCPIHISVVLQRDLNALMESSTRAIFNNAEEMAWLREQIRHSVFDLYAIEELNAEKYVFGCLQSKTSIRDRVGRDCQPSQQAMERCFWSVGVTLDGDFFKNQKFQEMVNSGPSFPQNGWHGMYVCSSPYYGGRIYTFDKFVEHAEKAARAWRSNHESLTHMWNAEKV